MSLKRFFYDHNIECCYTCQFIDEYTMNVYGDWEEPHGYDGSALCEVYDHKKEESNDNRWFISPLWKPCCKYKRCTERQADYLDIYDYKTKSVIPSPYRYLRLSENHYEVRRIDCKTAKAYIKEHHYSHGCHNGPSPCYGLFDEEQLIGVLMFATPCSENVRASVFGPEYKDWVTELHRLHILDVTPKNTESWFITQCLNLLKKDKPQIKAVLSFSDSTEGHEGVIYKATNAYKIGHTGTTTFYKDKDGRLRHPRQSGVNIKLAMAREMGWEPVKRYAKNRYLSLLPSDKREKRKLIKMCKYDLKGGNNE